MSGHNRPALKPRGIAVSDMLMAADGERSTLAEASVGSLVLVYGYSFEGLPGFVIHDAKGVNEIFMLEGDRVGGAALDSRTPVVSFGQAVARFDRRSFAKSDASLPTSSLVLSTHGVGVYEAGQFAARGGILALLNGEQVSYYRDYETPAFLRWD
ncbi:hypothetical protein [Novosphingobium endophyticum]|nr:hypothetical protein [Novosphingobium endophyticum]